MIKEAWEIILKPYEPEFKKRTLRMLAEALPEHAIVHAASKHLGGPLSISPDMPRIWHRQAQIDTGPEPDVTTDIAAENRRLQKENLEPRKANEILKSANLFFAKEPGQPRTK